MQNSASGNLPTQRSACTCKPFKQHLNEVKALCRCRGSWAREIREAYYIKELGPECVSETSAWLHNSEIKFIDDRGLGVRFVGLLLLPCEASSYCFAHAQGFLLYLYVSLVPLVASPRLSCVPSLSVAVRSFLLYVCRLSGQKNYSLKK